MTILNLEEMPDENPISKLLWLSGVKEQAIAELDAAYQEAYFTARLERSLDSAIALGLHSRKSILAFTRHENEARGRQIKNWGDDYPGA